MSFFSLLLIFWCVVTPSVVALSSVNSISPYWRVLDELPDPSTTISFSLGLKLRNVDQLQTALIDVSSPSSPHWRQHWSLEQINALTAPTGDAVKSVQRFLVEAKARMIDWTISNDFVTFELSVDEAERVFEVKFYLLEHKSTGRQMVRSVQAPLVPAALKKYIDIIGPFTRLPRLSENGHGVYEVKPASLAAANRHGVDVDSTAQPCDDTRATPDCLRRIYNISGAATAESTGTVTGYLEQYINENDLNTFFSKFDILSVGRQAPKITGPNVESHPGVEASLDIQYISAMAHNALIDFTYTAGRANTTGPGAQNEPFLAWVISFANSTDVPSYVVSTSYGDDEDTVDRDYIKRVDVEFVKLGLRGVSLLFSSGDSGAGGHGGSCTRFMPTLPASLPSVTSVGATGFNALGNLTERASYFSSGGFSDYFPRPPYQERAVNDYLTKYGTNLPPTSYYNSTNRAFPDIAGLGENYPIIVNGRQLSVAGTSCSSPMLAGLVVVLNSILLSKGQQTLGFLNPLIYEVPRAAFHDVTIGHSPGCNTPGFSAAVGWDPTTGVGTPNFSEWVKLVEQLSATN